MNTYILDRAAEQPAPPLECPSCGLPAAITDRFTLGGAPSAVAHLKLVCIAGHWCTPPIDDLFGTELGRHAGSEQAGAGGMGEISQPAGAAGGEVLPADQREGLRRESRESWSGTPKEPFSRAFARVTSAWIRWVGHQGDGHTPPSDREVPASVA